MASECQAKGSLGWFTVMNTPVSLIIKISITRDDLQAAFTALFSKHWHESGKWTFVCCPLQRILIHLFWWWLFLIAWIWAKCSTIHSPPAPPPPLFFPSFFPVEISSRTPIPVLRPGSVHSGSANWDDCGWVFPETCVWARFRKGSHTMLGQRHS